MIECFKTHSVQILGFQFYDAHAPTVAMASIKLVLAISAHTDLDLFYMNSTTAFISLKPGMIIYAIHRLVWILVLDTTTRIFSACGNCLPLLTILILQQLAGLSPAVLFSVCVLTLFLLVQGVHFGCIIILLVNCFFALTAMLMISFFQLSLCLWQGSAMQFISCPMIEDSQLMAILIKLYCLVTRCWSIIFVRLLSLTICLCKMMVESQSIVKFSSGLVLLLVLVTKKWNWIFMELLGLDCLFWYSSAWQCLLVPLFRIGAMSRVKLNILSSAIKDLEYASLSYSIFSFRDDTPSILVVVSQQLVQHTSNSLSSGVASFGLLFSCARSLMLFSLVSSH